MQHISWSRIVSRQLSRLDFVSNSNSNSDRTGWLPLSRNTFYTLSVRQHLLTIHTIHNSALLCGGYWHVWPGCLKLRGGHSKEEHGCIGRYEAHIQLEGEDWMCLSYTITTPRTLLMGKCGLWSHILQLFIFSICSTWSHIYLTFKIQQWEYRTLLI